jgi:hypothetical protein
MTSEKAADTQRAQHLAGLQLFAMSNLRSTEAGVAGAVIWVSAGEFAEADSHLGPRIMVVLGDSIAAERLKHAVSVRLTDPPEVLGDLPAGVRQQVVTFCVVNRDVLLRHWRGGLSTREMLDLLESI